MKNLKNKIAFLLVLVFSAVLLAFSIRGNIGNPIANQTNNDVIVGSPFESSNSTSRYALVEAMYKDHTFFLNPDLAKFASPDVSRVGDKFISIFTPGISFIGLPFYIIGSYFGLPQLFTYLAITIFGLLNIFLIAKVSHKLGVGRWVSYLAGLIFGLATNSFSYGATFTQHEVSTSIILTALLTSLGETTLLKNIIFGALFGLGALMDIPNLFFLAPIGLYILVKNFQGENLKDRVELSLKLSVLGLVIGVIPFLGLFGYYNHQTTGSYTKLGQTIGRTTNPTAATITPQAANSSQKITLLNTPFETRDELASFYVLVLSNERSWIYYSPVILIGLLGLFIAIKEKKEKNLAVLVASVLAINLVLYSMFSDPWGGWSFGPRYLIPGAAMLCVGVGVVLQKFKKNFVFAAIFLVLLLYSLAISSLGAITTNAIPPKVEAIHLSQPIPYTYEYNLNILGQGKVSSLIYNLGLKNSLNSYQFWMAETTGAFLFLTFIYFLSWREEVND